MKKKIIATISCALAVFAFTGCGQTASIAFNGSYWNKDTSNETPAGKEEIIEYGVYSVEENELWNKTQTNAVLKFKTREATDETGKTVSSSYKTVLKSNDDGTFTYKTTLTVYGTYKISGNEEISRDFTDVTETETTFEGYNTSFRPIKSVKKVSNTVPYPSGSTYSIKNARYVSTIDYTEKDAAIKIEILEGDESPEQFGERAKKDITISKYNKNAYIDMELMLLLFRNFKHEANMSCSFKTIEPLSGELNSVTGSVFTRASAEKNSSSYDYLTTCSLKKVLLGTPPYHDYSFNVVRMDFSTSGTTGQTFMRAFYSQSYEGATDPNSTRHIPVMIAQPSIFNTGFLVYELRSATFI